MLDCIRNICGSCFGMPDRTPLLTPDASTVKASCSALLDEIKKQLEPSLSKDLTLFLMFKNTCNDDLNKNRLVTFENFQDLERKMDIENINFLEIINNHLVLTKVRLSCLDLLNQLKLDLGYNSQTQLSQTTTANYQNFLKLRQTVTESTTLEELNSIERHLKKTVTSSTK